jgi:uncharacterized DUF497 family protein
MEQLGIERLDVDPHIEDKLWAKHDHLSMVEVEQALMDDEVVVRRAGTDAYDVFGRTDGGLHLLVVLVRKGVGIFKVVTARPMNNGEVRWFERQRG